MPWFKVDDGFAFHPKAIEAGNAALGLWVRAGAWCGANLTDGALPRHMIGTLGAQARDARRLVTVGLWVETERGYQFHEWEKMQPTKADVEAERAENRKRQKAFRERQRNGVTNVVTDGVTEAATNGTPSRPVPTLPLTTTPTADAAAEFDQWYAAYPRKIDKGHARTAFKAARKKTSLETLMAAVQQFALHSKGTDPKFLAYPATWLNGERWEDEAPQQTVVTGPWSKDFHRNGTNA